MPAWLPTNNKFKELGAREKHHLADPALAARLLGVTKSKLSSGPDVDPAMPRDGIFLGALFVSLVALDRRLYAQAGEAQVRHLRTYRGEHEVDFIVIGTDGGIVAVEVKLSATVNDDAVSHLKWLRDTIGDALRDAVLVNTGRHA